MATPDTSRKLQHSIGASQFFTMGFGSTVGFAWIVMVGEWIRQAGPLGAVVGFALGALGMGLVGLCYAEVIGMFPVAGGEVAYTYEIYGIKTCFATGWFLALAFIAVTVFEGVTVAWIFNLLMPWTAGPLLYRSWGAPVYLGNVIIGVAGLAIITTLNYLGIKFAARLQDVLTYGKLALAAIFVGVAIWAGNTTNLRPLFVHSSSGSLLGPIFLVLMTAPYWLSGFMVVAQVMEERSNSISLKTIGRVLLLCIGAAALFYCVIIITTSMTMPWQRLVSLEMPAVTTFRVAFHSPRLSTLVLVVGLLGLITVWNGISMSASRVLFALGRSQIITPWFAKIHPVFGSPSAAIIFVGVVAACGIFLGRSALMPIVNVTSTCIAAAYVLVCVGAARLRITRPLQKRPYRAPGGIVMAGIAAVFALLIVLESLYQPYIAAKGAFPLEWISLLVWAALGLLFWAIARKRRQTVNEQERRELLLGADDVLS